MVKDIEIGAVEQISGDEFQTVEKSMKDEEDKSKNENGLNHDIKSSKNNSVCSAFNFTKCKRRQTLPKKSLEIEDAMISITDSIDPESKSRDNFPPKASSDENNEAPSAASFDPTVRINSVVL